MKEYGSGLSYEFVRVPYNIDKELEDIEKNIEPEDYIKEIKEGRYRNMSKIQEKADELSWMKVYALLGIDRREGALQLLDQLRHSEGEYMEKADSLYLIIYK